VGTSPNFDTKSKASSSCRWQLSSSPASHGYRCSCVFMRPIEPQRLQMSSSLQQTILYLKPEYQQFGGGWLTHSHAATAATATDPRFQVTKTKSKTTHNRVFCGERRWRIGMRARRLHKIQQLETKVRKCHHFCLANGFIPGLHLLQPKQLRYLKATALPDQCQQC